MEIYRGCCHRCIYCYVRSNYYEETDDFSKIRAKRDVLLLTRDELRRKRKPGIMLVGGVADSYNLEEKELKLTRYTRELLNAYDFGVCIITKSNLVKNGITTGDNG